MAYVGDYQFPAYVIIGSPESYQAPLALCITYAKFDIHALSFILSTLHLLI